MVASSAFRIARKAYYTPVAQGVLFRALKLAGRDRRLIQRYLRDHPVRKLQIGAGGNRRAGWLNTNWFPIEFRRNGEIFLDATAPFPLPDNSFDYIFSEHVIEHVTYSGGAAMLAECLRVLKPGGKLRLSTPDLAFLLDLQRPDLSPLQRTYVETAAKGCEHGEPATSAAVLNRYVRAWGHLFIYDRATLVDLLTKIGFASIQPCELGVSDDPHLCGLDNFDRMPEGFLTLESMAFEARKPV